MRCRIFMLFHPHSLLFRWSALLGKDCPIPHVCNKAKWKRTSSQSFVNGGHLLVVMVRRYWMERKNVFYSEKLRAPTQRGLHSGATNAEWWCLKVGRGEQEVEGQGAKEGVVMVPLLLLQCKWCVQMPKTFIHWFSKRMELGFILANPTQDLEPSFFSSKSHCTGWKTWMTGETAEPVTSVLSCQWHRSLN